MSFCSVSTRLRWLNAFLAIAIAMVNYRVTMADLVTFDELATWTSTGPKGSYYNGNSGTGSNTNGWSSGGVTFGNSYDTSFGGFWSGFAYSNINDPSTPGYLNQYAANKPTGLGGGGNYALLYSGTEAFWNFQSTSIANSIYVTNTAYTMYSILDGDQFTEKFGGPTGDDPDFFSIRFEGFTGDGGTGISTGTVDFYLADYRFADNTQDYVIRDWTQVSLASLGEIKSVSITFNSSDIGEYGINTPTYAAFDNLAFTAVPEPTSLLLGCLPLGYGLARYRQFRPRSERGRS